MLTNLTTCPAQEEDLYRLERQFRGQLKLELCGENSDTEKVPAELRYELRLPHFLRLFADGRVDLVKCIMVRSFHVRLDPEEIASLLLPAAACSGNLQCLRRIVEVGVNVNRLFFGRTALYWAVRRSHVDCVRVLLKAGADPNLFEGKVEYTPLTSAVCPRCVKALVESGANIDFVDEYGNSALSEAISRGDFKKSELLMDHGANLNPYDSDEEARVYSAPLLSLAVAGEHIVILGLLIGRGADIEATDKYGDTALLSAAKRLYVPGTKQLLDSYANAQVEDGNGCTALHHIAKNGPEFYVDKRDHLVEDRWKRISAHVKMLTAKGADPNAIDDMGRTPLSLAMDENNPRMIELLVEHGASDIGQGLGEKSALQIAREESGEVATAFRVSFHKGRLRKFRGVTRFIIVARRYRNDYYRYRRRTATPSSDWTAFYRQNNFKPIVSYQSPRSSGRSRYRDSKSESLNAHKVDSVHLEYSGNQEPR